MIRNRRPGTGNYEAMKFTGEGPVKGPVIGAYGMEVTPQRLSVNIRILVEKPFNRRLEELPYTSWIPARSNMKLVHVHA